MRSSWVSQIAGTLVEAHAGPVPDEILYRAALQTLDAIACAAGAVDATPTQIVGTVVAGSGPPEASLLFSGKRANVLDAVLVNGTAVRYLDFNDAFMGSGPGGHPSDNIVVALAVGERTGASGREVLSAIALGYEWYWRLRRRLYTRTERAGAWDGVSVSGVVGAAMAGLLLRLDHQRLAHAMAMGAAKGYGLKQLRQGSISMVKGCANALVARDGVLAALLATQGLTGPDEVFEGKSGFLRAFGHEPTDDLLAELTRPPEWAIRNISIKPYPAIGTSQAAIHAAIQLRRNGAIDPADIAHVAVRAPDSKATREHMTIEQRLRPDSRESADHSVPFLVACALEDGEISLAQFENERWKAAHTRALMERVEIVPDESLTKLARHCYPAVVTVTLANGTEHEQEVLATPGSPEAPWGPEDIGQKFARVQRLGWDQSQIDDAIRLVKNLSRAPDLSELLGLVGSP